MKQNVTGIGRIIRLLIAIVLAVLIFAKVVTGAWAIVLGIVALVMLATGIIGYCPLFAITGSSCPLHKK